MYNLSESEAERIKNQKVECIIMEENKDKKDDLLNGSVTYKIRVDALENDSQTYIKAPELNENNCQVIFTDYDDKKV